MISEFELIRRHFTLPTRQTALGVGDDAALIMSRAGMSLVVTSDMLVAGTHFFPDTNPLDLGWKTLAVNVSDIAAMAAEPRWAFLALALPAADETWIAAFARGFAQCAAHFSIDLAGGDTTRGPLTLSVTLIGEVVPDAAIRRDGAHPGDDLWVTGTPGRAALGLAHLRGEMSLPADAASQCLAALHRPQPRLAAGQALSGIASAMLDVSDGLLGDLGHLIARSGVGAEIMLEALPLPLADTDPMLHGRLQAAVLHGGDDYELLFAAPAGKRQDLAQLAARLDLPFTRIGRINGDAGRLTLIDAQGKRTPGQAFGYDHFRS